MNEVNILYAVPTQALLANTKGVAILTKFHTVTELTLIVLQ